ncbi:hypothetical protein [Taklimakanibacter lacteus]|uniref:hypothetical protein n=1 Tax=Taklimakanibacter lacteus TaxID=2268456 RepID=UPI0013C4DD75
MTDRTASRRVRKYRLRQARDRGIARVEVQVPKKAAKDIKDLSRKLRAASRNAVAAERPVQLVLGTINAPRPHPVDAQTLVHCLITATPDPHWHPHVEAFFDEVAPEAIHDLVLAKVLSFEDLYRAARNWRVSDAGNVAWIKEMADLRLAKPAA